MHRLGAALAGIRGKRFSSVDAAITFCVTELQHAVKAHLKKHKHHFNSHLLSDEEWIQVEGFVTAETLAALPAVLRPVQRR